MAHGTPDPDTQQRVRARAHAIWQAAGEPDGHDREHWAQAEREIDGEPAGGPPPYLESIAGIVRHDASAAGDPLAAALPAEQPEPQVASLPPADLRA